MTFFRRPLFRRWVEARLPRGEQVTLTHRSVYILPTGRGVAFAGVLAVLLLGAINYAIGLGFALTFLLAGTGLVSMLHTWKNLAGLQLQGARAAPVFAGGTARFHVRLQAATARYAVALRFVDAQAALLDIPAGGTEAILPLAAPRRGRLRAGRLEVATRFPLGLFRAWSWLELDMGCLVYPRPEEAAVPLPVNGGAGAGGYAPAHGEEDFAGLRGWRPADSPRHVAWKAVARSGEMLAKEFRGTPGQTLWLDWHALTLADTEARLARLARWVLAADAAGLHYGLRLPECELAPAGGTAHCHACLAALALHGLEAPS